MWHFYHNHAIKAGKCLIFWCTNDSPMLCRFVDRFRDAPPTSREERGKELFGSRRELTLFPLPPSPSTPQPSDITPSTPHTNHVGDSAAMSTSG